MKTFRAQSMREALALVKRTLGADAVIIYTKNIRAPGLRGFLGKQLVEIAAAAEVRNPPVSPQPAPLSGPGPAAAYGRQAPARRSGTDEQLQRLREEVLGIRSTLDELVRSNCPPVVAGLCEPLSEGYVTLVGHGLDERLAADVVRSLAAEMTETELRSEERVRERITGRLAEHVNVGGAIRLTAGRRQVVVLIGPTGVGKTTTIAKLAANFKVRGKRRVALITIDTYRIAAVQQLQTIADIIKVPLRTVLTVGDLKQALVDLQDYDLVLIDTAGRSQRDEVKMNDLKAFVTASWADEVHLVVSATGSMGNMLDVVKQFRDVGPNRLLITKVDEAEALGTLVSVSSRVRVPVSYVTTGQDIPDDIEVASAGSLASMVWER
ncbi:MAG TPA: flagellar biosynthesis protein FlhF [Planctomycetota bacterium]|nr:flagellar biosynthesis protein FlhF [Planctomycetota bacterium]